MVRYLLAALSGLIGCALGSFLNVIIDRLPAKTSILRPASHCPGCGRRLTPLELVPVLSYLGLRGRCRTCGERIPLRVPVVELATGAMLVLLFWRYGPSLRMVISAVYSAILLAVFVIDLEHQLVLNVIILPATVLALLAIPLEALVMRPPPYTYYAFLWLLFGQGSGLSVQALIALSAILGGVVAFGVFWLVWRIAPGAMGAGDVKLAAFAGLITGFPGALFAVFGSWMLGGVAALALLLGRRAGLKTAVPFAPFLVITALAMLLFGDEILFWYITR